MNNYLIAAIRFYLVKVILNGNSHNCYPFKVIEYTLLCILGHYNYLFELE